MRNLEKSKSSSEINAMPLFKCDSKKSRIKYDELIKNIRCEHYRFSHWALPWCVFHDPDRCLDLLSSEKSQVFLHGIWNIVVNVCQSEGQYSGLTWSDLEVSIIERTDHMFTVIEMHPVQGITEAHYVAIVRSRPILGGSKSNIENQVRYFTLNKGFSFDESDCTTVGEWLSDNRHLNYGVGPHRSIEAFVDFLEEKMALQSGSILSAG